MRGFQDCFEEYGADYTETMERFMKNEGLYLKILKMLPNDKSIEELDAALKENRREDAFRAAHALKGVSANLGLTPLYQAVCEILEPLRAQEERADYPVLCEKVRREIQRANEFCGALERDRPV